MNSIELQLSLGDFDKISPAFVNLFDHCRELYSKNYISIKNLFLAFLVIDSFLFESFRLKAFDGCIGIFSVEIKHFGTD